MTQLPQFVLCALKMVCNLLTDLNHLFICHIQVLACIKIRSYRFPESKA